MISLLAVVGIVGLYLGGAVTASAASAMDGAKDVVVDDLKSAGWGHAPKHNYTFETVKGFFLQDLDSTNNTGFDFIASNFGLASTAPLAWQAFEWSIKELNKQAPHNVSYRVLYLARHGEGWHNVAESFYGTPAWDDKWSKLNTDGNMTWGPDAQLTPLGIQQAHNVSAAWKIQSAAGAPLPQSFYSSPLTRSSDTLNITWSSVPSVLIGTKHAKAVPVILEGLRETIGVHTCDKRHNKTWIAQREPNWVFEKGFSEEDELWTAEDRESDGAQQARIREALVQILDNDDSTYISITAHSGTVGAALRAIGHRAFSLATGAMIPVVIKATKEHVGDL